MQEAHIRRLQATLSHAWEQQRGRIEAVDASLAYAELQHAMSLVRPAPVHEGQAPGCTQQHCLLDSSTRSAWQLTPPAALRCRL